MAETQESAEKQPTSGPSNGRKFRAVAIVLGIMLLEGGGLFIVTKSMYKKPASAAAEELTHEEQTLRDVQAEVELPLPEVNAFNRREGRLYLYTLEITVRVKADKVTDVEPILAARESTIKDRFNTVIRSADTKYLNEPGLDTIRRQFRFELDKVLGDDELIIELLIPKFFQSPANV